MSFSAQEVLKTLKLRYEEKSKDYEASLCFPKTAKATKLHEGSSVINVSADSDSVKLGKPGCAPFSPVSCSCNQRQRQ